MSLRKYLKVTVPVGVTPPEPVTIALSWIEEPRSILVFWTSVEWSEPRWMAVATVGVCAKSSFVIVPTPVLSVMVASTGFESVTLNVSLGSTTVSPQTFTVSCLDVSVARKLSVVVEMLW